MRLLIVSRNISNIWGGFEEHIYRLYQGLTKRGIDVYFITTDIHEIPHKKFPHEKMHVIHSHKVFGYGYFDKKHLINTIKKIEPDIIHVHGWGSFIIERTISYCYRVGLKCVLTPHEFFHKMNLIKKMYNLWFKRYYLSKPDMVIALTDSQLRAIKKYTNSVVKIPNGVDNDEFSRSRPKLGEYLLSVGRFEKYKGFDEVLDVSKITGKKVIIAGRPGNYYNKLLERIRKEKMNVSLLLNVNRKKLLELYSNANIFIHPSNREGFGIVIIESLASGTPVISKPVGVASDLQSKFCRTYKDFNQLISLVDEMWEMKKNKKEIAKLRRRILADYSWKNVIKKHIEVYESVLRR